MQNVMCSLPDAIIASFGEFAIEIEYFENNTMGNEYTYLDKVEFLIR